MTRPEATIEKIAPPDPALSREQNSRFVLEMTAVMLEHRLFSLAATSFVSQLALQLGCERVSIGLLKKHTHRIVAVSHNAEAAGKAQIFRDLADIMNEASEQNQPLAFPEIDDWPTTIVTSHTAFARRYGRASVFTVPLYNEQNLFGAISFEWDQNISAKPIDLRLLQHLATLAGPVLASKYEAEHPLKTWLHHRKIKKATNPRKWLLRSLLVAIPLLLIVLGSLPVTYRLDAKVNIEARELRVVVAPIDGYINSARKRAGDTLIKGDELGRLDSQELELEKEKLANELQQMQREYRGALASQDRTRTNIFKARSDQVKARLALIAEKIKRTNLISPIDGYVVTGDLTQSIGSPITRGDTLFEIAPLDTYRLILQVDERDIDDVQIGHKGILVLNGVPDQSLEFVVQRITPASTTKNNHNYFRVEAKLNSNPAFLRPGMTGAAKIDVDKRPAAWIAMHRLIDWLRLKLWSFIW